MNSRRYHIRSHGEYNATPLPKPICGRGGIDPGLEGTPLAADGLRGRSDNGSRTCGSDMNVVSRNRALVPEKVILLL